jgi:DNA-binding CsgD family transcriptional regulator
VAGLPDSFVQAYERFGAPLDQVLAKVRQTGTPWSSKILLGSTWKDTELYQRISGQYRLLGFVTFPLFRRERLIGVLDLGTSDPGLAQRLNFDQLCELSSRATQVATALAVLPKFHPRLTERQNDIARFTAQGLSNLEIAEELDTGEAAVRKHLKALNRIFGTANRTAMAAEWRRGIE